MGYYDDDYDEYYEYDDRIEPVGLISELFSEKVITEVLITAGLVSERSPKYSGNMEKLVFVFGDENEVYSLSEIQFTEGIDQVFMYSDFNHSMRNGKMLCRVIATKIHEEGHDAITSCVAFEKIVNKALDGFNIFLFVTNDSVFFGCRIFDKNGKYDCALSNPILEETRFEEILDEFAYTAGIESFLDYYDQVRRIIKAGQDESPSYEDFLIRQQGIHQSYLSDLDEIGRSLGVDFSKEKARYIEAYNSKAEESFIALLDGVCESLSFIKSNCVNTYEMLFEADEMMRQDEATEVENERLVFEAAKEHRNQDVTSDEEVTSLLKNPEEMVKLLKKRRGL